MAILRPETRSFVPTLYYEHHQTYRKLKELCEHSYTYHLDLIELTFYSVLSRLHRSISLSIRQSLLFFDGF